MTIPAPEDKEALDILGIRSPRFVARGAQSSVYRIDPRSEPLSSELVPFREANEVILKLQSLADFDALEATSRLLRRVEEGGLPYATPLILGFGRLEQRIWVVERLIPGAPLSRLRPELSNEDERRALSSFLHGLRPLHGITLYDYPYGQALPGGITDPSWSGFLIRSIDSKLCRNAEALAPRVRDLDRKRSLLLSAIEMISTPKKALVHGDYYFANVLVDRISLTMTGLVDFSICTVVGDPFLDWALALGSVAKLEAPLSEAFLVSTEERFGVRIPSTPRPIFHLSLYTLYYALFFSGSWEVNDQQTFEWCVRTLESESLFHALMAAE